MHTGKISVLLPAYNEGAVIGSVIRETAHALGAQNYEIIVVDDGSVDATFARAQEEAVSNPRVRVIRHQPNRGKGYALKQGFAQATGDLIAFLDADADLPPRQLARLVAALERTQADVVIGSKMHPESKSNYPPLRRVVSWGYYALVRFFFGLPLHDTQTGIKLFRRQVLEQVFPHLHIEGFAVDLELLVAAHLYGYTIHEAPVEIVFGRQPTNLFTLLRSSLNMAWDTLRVFYWASFWKWLNPGLRVKLWIITLIVGLVAASVAAGHLLNNFTLPSPLDGIVNFLLLRFLDRILRDLILLSGGLLLTLIAAVQLNKQIVAAFGRKGESNFWKRDKRG